MKLAASLQCPVVFNAVNDKQELSSLEKRDDALLRAALHDVSELVSGPEM
jgi:hypothetical protein